jgi:hypothetical protein
MTSTLTVTIINGEAVVTADGTPASCKAAEAVETALGKVTKSTPTGHKSVTSNLTQK